MSINGIPAELPDATAQPCKECPWRRCAAPGWLGPHSAMEWIMAVGGEAPIACHCTIRDTDAAGTGSWDHPMIKQCRGAAIYRANTSKLPMNPEIVIGPKNAELVFDNPMEFIAHHEGGIDGGNGI